MGNGGPGRSVLDEAQSDPTGVLARADAAERTDDLLEVAAAVALRQLGRIDDSLARFEAVLARASDPDVVVEARKRRAVALAYGGQLERGLADLDDLATTAPEHHQGEILHQRAGLLQLAGRGEEARRAYEVVLERWWGDLSPLWRGHALMNLGLLTVYDGDVAGSIDLLERARASYTAAEQPVLATLAVENQAWIRGITGDTAVALRLYDEVDAELEDVHGLRRETRAVTRAEVFLRGGLVRRAVTALEEGLEFLRRDGNSLLAAETMVVLAEAHLRANDPGAAAGTARAAERELAGQGRVGWGRLAEAMLAEATLLTAVDIGLADPYLELCDRLRGAGHGMASRRLVALLLAVFPDDERVRAAASELDPYTLPSIDVTRLAVGRSHAAQDPLEVLDAAFVIVDARADRLGAAELHGDVQRAVAGLADRALRRCLATGIDHSVWADRRRTVTLSRWPRTADPEFDALLGRLRAAVSRDRNENLDAATTNELQQTIGALRREVSDRAIKVASAGRATGGSGSSGGVVDLCVLDDTVLVGGGGPTSRVDGAPFESLRARYDMWCLAGAGDRHRASMERSLLDVDRALAPDLPVAEVVTFVVDATLRALPWGLLPSLRDRAFTIAPAHSMIRPPRGDPMGPDCWIHGPGLSTADDEAGWRARTGVPVGRIASTSARAVKLLDGAGVAYIAAHGRVEPGNPFFGGLALDDGELVMHDLSTIDRPPRGVVLSSCFGSSATATEVDTGPISLADSFLALGADWVVATGAALSDDHRIVAAVSDLRRSIRTGEHPAAALRALRVQCRGELGHPANHLVCYAVDGGGAQSIQSVA